MNNVAEEFRLQDSVFTSQSRPYYAVSTTRWIQLLCDPSQVTYPFSLSPFPSMKSVYMYFTNFILKANY